MEQNFLHDNPHNNTIRHCIGARGVFYRSYRVEAWNVRSTPIHGNSGIESGWYQAILCPEKMRALYNERTDLGGVCVLQSSSFGEQREPSPTSLWCAMYDAWLKYGFFMQLYSPDDQGDLCCGSHAYRLRPVLHDFCYQYQLSGRSKKFFRCILELTTNDLGATGDRILSTMPGIS